MRGSYYKWRDQKQSDGKRFASSHCLNPHVLERHAARHFDDRILLRMPRIATIFASIDRRSPLTADADHHGYFEKIPQNLTGAVEYLLQPGF